MLASNIWALTVSAFLIYHFGQAVNGMFIDITLKLGGF